MMAYLYLSSLQVSFCNISFFYVQGITSAIKFIIFCFSSMDVITVIQNHYINISFMFMIDKFIQI